MTTEPARNLVEEIRTSLADDDRAIREHPYPAAFEEQRVGIEALHPFVSEEYYIAQSDLRSFALMTQRFGERPDRRAFFSGIYASEDVAVNGLLRLCAQLGLSTEQLDAYEVEPTGFGYAAYVAWCATYASAAEVAAALLVNFAAWGTGCRRLRDALHAHYGLTSEDTVYMNTFADLPDFEDVAVEIIQEGLNTGVPPHKIHRAARLFQGYEKLFWDAMAFRAGTSAA